MLEEKWFCSKMTSALALNFDDPLVELFGPMTAAKPAAVSAVEISLVLFVNNHAITDTFLNY